MAGRAVGQMFAGLTLANVLGVPAGDWIGNAFDWHTTFLVVAGLGLLSMLAIALVIERQPRENAAPISQQLAAFRSWNLLASLLFTVLGWAGFMTLYGYIAPLAEEVAGFERSAITGVLVVVGLGLVLGNNIGGHSADRNLRRSLLVWPLLTILALLLVGVVEHYTWPFLIATFLFGVATFRQSARHADAGDEIWPTGPGAGGHRQHLGIQHRQRLGRSDRWRRCRQSAGTGSPPLLRGAGTGPGAAVHSDPGAKRPAKGPGLLGDDPFTRIPNRQEAI